ncbi:MAG: hypothetical protein AAGH19_10490, partial [Pseudomonadota bacterium]
MDNTSKHKRSAAARSRVQLCLLVLLTFSSAPYWWPMMRCLFDERSFRWSYTLLDAQISGQGHQGDFAFLALITTLTVGFLFMGWTRGGRVFAALATVWFALRLFGATSAALSGGLMFYGDSF